MREINYPAMEEGTTSRTWYVKVPLDRVLMASPMGEQHLANARAAGMKYAKNRGMTTEPEDEAVTVDRGSLLLHWGTR